MQGKDMGAYTDLHGVKLQTIRQAVAPERYTRSVARALFWFAFDLALYLAAIAGVFLSHGVLGRLFFGAIAGCAVAFMFVWAHDAAHGALFKSRRVSEVLGSLFMLPSLNMYRLWSYGHNKVHHGFTCYTPIDWIWRPITPAEYVAKSFLGRLIYRLERSPYTCALHYLLRVWWPGMVRFKPDPNMRDRHLFTFSKIVTLAFFLGYSFAAYRYAGGAIGVLAVVIVPFLVFNYFISLFVFLNHTHPDIPFFDDRKEWSNTIGQVYCSTVVRCSALSEMLIHNILIHVPHHTDNRIPFYHLKKAYEDIRREYGHYIHEYRFSFSTVGSIFRRCKLYDYENKVWYSFLDAARLAKKPAVEIV